MKMFLIDFSFTSTCTSRRYIYITVFIEYDDLAVILYLYWELVIYRLPFIQYLYWEYGDLSFIQYLYWEYGDLSFIHYLYWEYGDLSFIQYLYWSMVIYQLPFIH